MDLAEADNPEMSERMLKPTVKQNKRVEALRRVRADE
jgi:hypothetical protein